MDVYSSTKPKNTIFSCLIYISLGIFVFSLKTKCFITERHFSNAIGTIHRGRQTYYSFITTRIGGSRNSSLSAVVAHCSSKSLLAIGRLTTFDTVGKNVKNKKKNERRLNRINNKNTDSRTTCTPLTARRPFSRRYYRRLIHSYPWNKKTKKNYCLLLNTRCTRCREMSLKKIYMGLVCRWLRRARVSAQVRLLSHLLRQTRCSWRSNMLRLHRVCSVNFENSFCVSRQLPFTYRLKVR